MCGEKVSLFGMSWNVQGLATKSLNKQKLPEFMEIFQSYHVVLFTGIWTNKLSCIAVDGFSEIPLHRTEKKPGSNRDYGGIIFYYRNSVADIIELVYTDSDDMHNICIKLKPHFFISEIFFTIKLKP